MHLYIFKQVEKGIIILANSLFIIDAIVIY